MEIASVEVYDGPLDLLTDAAILHQLQIRWYDDLPSLDCRLLAVEARASLED